ncbi:MAG: T9SS type A sorting domain-containing protein [Bacteroidetes bacterium]|nr:T9SS type A sorting domain-containing protein [Bacteroidota bacterium]
MTRSRLLLICTVLFASHFSASAQDWQWLQRIGQRLDASSLGAGGSWFAEGPKNLELDREGKLILTAAVGRYPDTCHNPLYGGCSVDSEASRPFNALIARYDCSGHRLWRQYIGFITANTQLYQYFRDLGITPNIFLSKDKSEIVIVDRIVANDSIHPTQYSIGDTLINIPYTSDIRTNILARIDLNGHLKFFKATGTMSNGIFWGDIYNAPNYVFPASNGDIIGLTAYTYVANLHPSIPSYVKLWDDSILTTVPAVYQGFPREYLTCLFRADSVGHMKWATPIAGYTLGVPKMFIDGKDNVTIQFQFGLSSHLDSTVIGNLKIQDTSALHSTNMSIYRPITRADGNGHLLQTIVPNKDYAGYPLVINLEYADREGNSYVLVQGRSERDTFMGVRFHRSVYPYSGLSDSAVKVLFKLDTNLHPIWHFTTNDSSSVDGYALSSIDSIFDPGFGECLRGHYGEDWDNHIYVPIALGSQTFYWQGRHYTAPISNAAANVPHGRPGFAVVDKTTAEIVSYHLLDNQLQLPQSIYGERNYAFSYPVVDDLGNFYSANFLEGYQIAGHDTIQAYHSSDDVDIALWKWGLSNCRTDTSLLSPRGYGDSLQADGVSASQIRVHWIDSATYETGYRIYRSPDGQAGWQLIDSVGPGVTTYVNGGLPQQTVYYYRVAAVNGSQQAATYSNIDSGQTWRSTGIENVQNNTMLSVYPNPASSLLNVECIAAQPEDVRLEIYDAMGQQIYTMRVSLSSGYQQQAIDVSHFATGSYYVSVAGQYTSVHTAVTIVR